MLQLLQSTNEPVFAALGVNVSDSKTHRKNDETPQWNVDFQLEEQNGSIEREEATDLVGSPYEKVKFSFGICAVIIHSTFQILPQISTITRTVKLTNFCLKLNRNTGIMRHDNVPLL